MNSPPAQTPPRLLLGPPVEHRGSGASHSEGGGLVEHSVSLIVGTPKGLPVTPGGGAAARAAPPRCAQEQLRPGVRHPGRHRVHRTQHGLPGAVLNRAGECFIKDDC